MESLLSEEEVTRIAMITHQVNKAICECSGDTSQANWEDAPDWQKESAIDGIIKSANHTAAGKGQMNPEESHNSWLSYKLREGWKYGEVKNSETKEHPNLLPWKELPRDERLKDVIFGGIVHFYSVFRENADAA